MMSDAVNENTETTNNIEHEEVPTENHEFENSHRSENSHREEAEEIISDEARQVVVSITCILRQKI